MEHRVEFLPIQKAYSVARTNGEGASQDKEMYEIYCRKFDKEVFEKALKKLCTAHPMLLAKTDIHEGFQIIDFGEDIKPDYIEPDRRYVSQSYFGKGCCRVISGWFRNNPDSYRRYRD